MTQNWVVQNTFVAKNSEKKGFILGFVQGKKLKFFLFKKLI